MKVDIGMFDQVTNNKAYHLSFNGVFMRGRENIIIGNSQREMFLPMMNDLLPGDKDIRVLDVGAGSGEIVKISDLKKYNLNMSLLEPNPYLLEEYHKTVSRYNGKISHSIQLPVQDYYSKTLGNHDLILAIHMIYHLTDFNDGNSNPSDDLVKFVEFLLNNLEKGGSIFLVYAQQHRSTTGNASFNYFSKFEQGINDNLKRIWDARTELFENKKISDYLPCSIQSSITDSYIYGVDLEEIAISCLSGELGASDEQLFDIEKIHETCRFLEENREPFRIDVESSGPRKGMVRAYQPQVVSVLKKV